MVILYERSARSILHAALLCALDPAAEPMLREEFQRGLRIDEASHESIYRFSRTCREVIAAYPAASWLRFRGPLAWVERALFFGARSRAEGAAETIFAAIHHALHHGIDPLIAGTSPPARALHELVRGVIAEIRAAADGVRLVRFTDGRTRCLVGRYRFRHDVADLAAHQLAQRYPGQRIILLDRQRAVVAQGRRSWVEPAEVYLPILDHPERAPRVAQRRGAPAAAPDALPKIPRRYFKWLEDIGEV